MADSPAAAPSKHTVLGAWLFGTLLLLFCMAVFVFAPTPLPDYKQKQLAIFSALLCALFTFFWVGTLKVNLRLKSRWTKLGIQSGGGAAAFVLVLWWWNNPDFAPVKSVPVATQSVTMTGSGNIIPITDGPNSPIINSGGGEVNVQYGVPQKVVDRLLKELDEKDIKLQERDSLIASWIQKYKELESQLASRTDDLAKQAQALLADGLLDEAGLLFKQALANDLQNAAANAFALAKIKALQLDYPEAKIYYQQAVQLAPENTLYLNDLGYHLHTLGEYAEAEPLYQRSLAIKEKALGKDHPYVALSLNNLAALYDKQGKYSEAEPLYQRSLAIWEKALGKDHPDVAISLDNLAGLYDVQGKYSEAGPLHQRSLAIFEKALGKDHPDVATSLNNLAFLYQSQGKYLDAEPLYQRSLAIFEKALGKDHPSTKTTRDNLGGLQAHLKGQYQVQVKAVMPDSQAEKLGILAGDILAQYRNGPVLGTAAFIYGRSLEPAANPAQELMVMRDGKPLLFQVKQGKIGAELKEILLKKP